MTAITFAAEIFTYSVLYCSIGYSKHTQISEQSFPERSIQLCGRALLFGLTTALKALQAI